MAELNGTSAAARGANCAESTARRLADAGIVKVQRDSAGRRLFDAAAMEALRIHVAASKGRQQT